MRWVIVVLLAVSGVACGEHFDFDDEIARFNAINTANPHDIGIKVLGDTRNSEIWVRAGQSFPFDAWILVAHRQSGLTGPTKSSSDKQTTVDVAVRDLVTGKGYTLNCPTGAKIITGIYYEPRLGGFDSVYCRANYTN
ncbi:MAG: hypothetical protein Q7R67_02905 [bacterium]|nr:hypothetical protein [bacterium]